VTGPEARREIRSRADGAPDGTEAFRSFFSDLPEALQPASPETPRGRILANARSLFARGGFAGTTVRAIAKGAGVNQAMIHYYFGSKELLYRRVIALELLATIRGVFDRIDSSVPAVELLVRIPIGIMREMRANPERLSLLRRELGAGAEQARAAVVEMSRHGPLGIYGLLAPLVRRGQEAGEIRDVPIDALLPFLVSAGHGSMILDPFFRLVLGIDAEDEEAWERRVSGFETLLRHAIFASGVKQ